MIDYHQAEQYLLDKIAGAWALWHANPEGHTAPETPGWWEAIRLIRFAATHGPNRLSERQARQIARYQEIGPLDEIAWFPSSKRSTTIANEKLAA